MGRRRSAIVQDEDTELNMTPMLDVVFILLIFFIVTSVFVKTPGIDPLKPSAETMSMRDENPKAEAIINADKDAEVGVVMSVQEMMQDLGITTRVGTK